MMESVNYVSLPPLSQYDHTTGSVVEEVADPNDRPNHSIKLKSYLTKNDTDFKSLLDQNLM